VCYNARIRIQKPAVAYAVVGKLLQKSSVSKFVCSIAKYFSSSKFHHFYQTCHSWSGNTIFETKKTIEN
jgi:hypothetical protein